MGSRCYFLWRVKKASTYELLIFRVQVPLKALDLSNFPGDYEKCMPCIDSNGRCVQVEINLNLVAVFFLLRMDQRFVL